MYPEMLAQRGLKINTQNHPKKPKKLLISVLLIAMQSAAIWLVFLQSLVAVITGNSTNFLATIFLVLILFFFGLWVSNISLGLFRIRSWALSAALVLQLMLAAIGTASFAGEFANPVIGAAILIPSAVIFVLLFDRTIRGMFKRS